MNRPKRSTAVAGRSNPRRSGGVRPSLEGLEARLVMSGVNVSMYHNDAASSGVNAAETTLSPNNVKVGSFGKLYQTSVDGAVYTQPLVQTGVTIASGANTSAGAAGLHDIVLVGTENDSVYALDTVSGAVLWKRSFLDTTNPTGDTNNTLNATAIAPVPYADTSSGDINPTIGITGTPVIDPTTQVAYLVAVTKETIGGAAHYVQRLHAINLADGTDKVAPSLIGDTTNGNTNNTPIYDYGTGDGAVTDPYNGTGKPVVQFNALRENERCSLDLENGSIYVEWASHGDNGPYHGWVTRYDVSQLSTAGLKLTGVLDTSPNGYEAGIWQGGGKLSFDSSGAFYLVTGNGANGVPVTLNAQGLVSNADYYEAVIKVVSDPTSTPSANNPNGWGLKVADFFIPHNSQNLDGADQDFGSGAPLVLPDSAGIPGHPHLLVAAGKQGVVYVIDRDNMGKFNATTDAVVSEQNLVGGALGTPAFFNNEIYYLGDYSSNLRALALSPNGTLSIASQTNPAVNFSGLPGSPSISANGTTGGIVWNLDRSGTNSLHAFDASDLSNELWNSNQAPNGADSFGYSIKFGTPTIANGEVFIGTNTNAVVAFGLKPPPTQPPAAPSNLAATAPSSTSVNLTWTDNSTSPNLATSFTVQDSTDGVHFSTVTTVPGGKTSITIGGLLSNTLYYFQIDASNGINASAYTKPVQINTGVTSVQAPAAPSALNGTPTTATSVVLNWTNNATNQTGFYLDRATDSGFTQNLVTQTLPASPFSFTDTATGLAPGGTYYYRIRAFNAVSPSGNSNSTPVLIPDAPAKATNAAVTNVTSTEIDLSWTDNAGRTATGYNILRSTNNGTFATIATLPADNNAPPSAYTWADTSVVPGTSYEYHIEAVNTSGNNDFAGANAETITLAPSGLTPTLANGQVTLSWTAPVGALDYNIYRGTAPGQEMLYQSGITATTYTDTAATAGTTYYYTVTAVNNNINHAPVLPSESGKSGEVSTPSASGAPPAVNFPNGFASGTAGVLTFNNKAAVVGSSLQLTDGGNYENRSVYTTNTVPINAFSTTFNFLISNNANAADGFTFVVQGVGNTVTGGIGSSLGYASSVTKSLALKFDLYNNSGEGINSTGLYTNGAAPTNVGSIDLTPSGVNLHGGDPMTATITYDGSNLTETITDATTHASFGHTYAGVSIASLVGGNQAYVGFTAGTGGASATQSIQSWTYTPTAAPTATAAPAAPTNLALSSPSSASVNLTWTDNSTSPNRAASFAVQDSTDGVNFGTVATVPVGTTSTTVTGLASRTLYYFRVYALNAIGSSGYSNAPSISTTTAPAAGAINFPGGFASGTAGVLTFNNKAAVVGSNLQLSDGGTFENRTVFTTNTVPINAFSTTFNFLIAPGASTGDGFAFAIQGVGNTASGGIGGALGYQGIAKSLALKFDLYNNSGEGINSTGLYTNGAAPTNVGSIDLTPSGVNLHGGDPMTATITYDGSNLTETITDATTHASFGHTYAGVNIASLVGGNQAYVGFTAGTGGSTATQNIQSWTYSSTAPAAIASHAISSAPASPVAALVSLPSDFNSTGINNDGATSGASKNLSSGTKVSLGSTNVPNALSGYSFTFNKTRAIKTATPPNQSSLNPLTVALS